MASRTVGEIKAYAAQMLSEHEDDPVLAGSTAEDLADLIERWLTRSWDRIATWRDWVWLQDTIELTWNSSGVLYLPHYVQRIMEIVPATGRSRVRIVNAVEYSDRRSQENILLLHGWYGVEADMPSAATVTATSASAAAANGLQVRVEGLTNASPGYEQIETITLAGLGTATTSATFKSGQGGVRRINIVPGTVPTAGTGVVTVTAGGTTIERLDANREREHEHRRTELDASGGAGQTHTIRYIRRSFNVTAEADIIPIPNEFTDLLELGIMIELERLKKNYANVQALRQEWAERMKELSAWTHRVGYQPRSIQAPRAYSA